MRYLKLKGRWRTRVLAGLPVVPAALALPAMLANPPALVAQGSPRASLTRQIGTVVSISGADVTLKTDAGASVHVLVASDARVLQLPPGSTDLKSAQKISLADVAVGDRVLVAGPAGAAAGELTASRVILMKASDIEQQHAKEEQEWQRNGAGGVVKSVDPATGKVEITSGGKMVSISTTPRTIFRRYAGDSVRFEDAKLGTLTQIHTGDQMRVRGTRSADGGSLEADEIVSGSFENLAGTLTAVNAGAGTATLKDLATRRTVIVHFTANSSLHRLPEGAAAMLMRAGEHSTGGAGAEHTSRPAAAATGQPGGRRAAGADLAQMIARLPRETVADLHPGESVLLVGAPVVPGSSEITAINLLSGAQGLLAGASPGETPVTLSPWSLDQAPADAGSQ